MSELSPDKPETYARILTLIPTEDDRVKFRVGYGTKGRDVLATLAYINPDPEIRMRNIMSVLRAATEDFGMLNGRKVKAPHSQSTGMGQELPKTKIDFSEKPTFKDVTDAYEKVYGEESGIALTGLLSHLIDKGEFFNISIDAGYFCNEIVNATDEEIATEMIDLTHQFYYGDI